ncbi:hypothetical protein [Polymorphobacter multimanifer]|uniref:hypothetical protein n=1 Tax=Polymorphobacter multimanifer TaxID=1070431 RepID=UPI00166D0203|nr:hypothetical protein [Polymorphobacter multimanifer]
MTMLLQEWRITWRVPMFRWACLALALLTIACLWNGQRFKADRDAQVRAEIERSVAKRSADREPLLRVEAGREPPPFWGAGEPNSADWNAARPSGPLAALSFGREDIQPFSANVSLFMVRADNLFRKFEFGSTYALAAGRFDAGFLVVLLLPLALLMLTYNVVAEERETGRLRLAAIQSSAFGRRLALRLLLRALPVFACLLVIAAAALLWGAPGGRLAVWTGSATLYLFFWLGVAAITAGLPWRQHVLALAGAGIWLVIAVLLPAMGGAIAEMIAPGPSAFVEINHVREASNRANLRINETLKGYVTEHPELQGDNDEYWPAKLYAAQRVVEAEVGPVLANRAVIQAHHDL